MNQTAIQTKERSRAVVLRSTVYVAAMLLLLFLRNGLGIGIPVSLLLLLSGAYAILGTNTEILTVALCCIPFSTGYQYKYAILACCAGLILRNFRRIRISRLALVIAAICFYELLFSAAPDYSYKEYVRSVIELVFLALLSCTEDPDVDYAAVLRSFAFAAVGVAFIMLFIQLRMLGFSFFKFLAKIGNGFRFGQENTAEETFGLNFNANGFGYICVLSTMAMLWLFSRREGNGLDLLLLIASIGFAVLTLSRTAIVCLAFLVLAFLALPRGSLRKKIGRFVGLVLLVALVFLLLRLLFPEAITSLGERFSRDDITGGRAELFAFYNDVLFSSWKIVLVGIGIQNFEGKILSIMGYCNDVCHNGFQEIWIVWGIVGMIWLAVFLYFFVRRTKRNNPTEGISRYIPFVLFLLTISAGQFVRSGSTLLSLVLVYLLMSIPPKEKELPAQKEAGNE